MNVQSEGNMDECKWVVEREVQVLLTHAMLLQGKLMAGCLDLIAINFSFCTKTVQLWLVPPVKCMLDGAVQCTPFKLLML